MGPQDLFDLLRRRPFVPFRIFATDGRTFDVRHPDQALVLRTRADSAVAGGFRGSRRAIGAPGLTARRPARRAFCRVVPHDDVCGMMTPVPPNHGCTASLTSRWNSSRSLRRSEG